MATPEELDALSAGLRGAYESAWADIAAEQALIADDPAQFARRARLKELQAAVDDRLDFVDEAAASWLADDFPVAYRMGADTAGGVLDQPFRWTTHDNEAITLMARDTFDELLAATTGVSDSTKRLIRRLGKEQALLKAAAGRTAPQAARQLRRLLEDHGIFAVTYRDGSRHGLADYTDMLLRTKTGVAHNAGLLNFGRRSGTLYYEVFDGADCGWFTHDDNDKANRSIRHADECAKATLSHPRCRRSFGPRPDITSPEQAKAAKSSITDAQALDQAAAERARAAALRKRANTRKRQQTARNRRAAQRQARNAARASRQADLDARRARAGTQGDLDVDNLPRLPKPADLPGDADGIGPDDLARAKKELPALKSKVRQNAGDVRDEARYALDAADSFRMAPPYARGSIEERSTGLYDWFYNLSPEEQRRLKTGGWFKGHRQTANPDQIAERMGQFMGGGDFDSAMKAWVDETRRYDSAGALMRGRIPLQSRYGDLDIDGVFGDGTFKVADLFDTDTDRAVRSVATTYKEQSEEFAGRTFVKGVEPGRQPYEMTREDYVDELTRVEAQVQNAQPVRSDPEFGDEYSPEDQAALDRLNQLAPPGVEGSATLPPDELYDVLVEHARAAGLA